MFTAVGSFKILFLFWFCDAGVKRSLVDVGILKSCDVILESDRLKFIIIVI